MRPWENERGRGTQCESDGERSRVATASDRTSQTAQASSISGGPARFLASLAPPSRSATSLARPVRPVAGPSPLPFSRSRRRTRSDGVEGNCSRRQRKSGRGGMGGREAGAGGRQLSGKVAWHCGIRRKGKRTRREKKGEENALRKAIGRARRGRDTGDDEMNGASWGRKRARERTCVERAREMRGKRARKCKQKKKIEQKTMCARGAMRGAKSTRRRRRATAGARGRARGVVEGAARSRSGPGRGVPRCRLSRALPFRRWRGFARRLEGRRLSSFARRPEA